MPRLVLMMIGLVMIVRDEQDVISRCLVSVRPHIQNWCIVDTGSVDDTPRIVQEMLADLPGELHHREWRDFGTNRTEALKLAQGTADYLLMPDADMELVIAGELPELTAAVYDLEILGFPVSYRMPKLTRGDLEWRYEDVVHEYLTGNGYPQNEAGRLDCWKLRAHHTPERMEGKGERYAELLENHLKTHAKDPRSLFYLAQIYNELGRIEDSIRLYRKRINVGGWEEESFYARYRLGCLLSQHVSFAEGAQELLAAWQLRPSRIEPLRALANAANDVANKAAVPDDLLFVHKDLYRQPDERLPKLLRAVA